MNQPKSISYTMGQYTSIPIIRSIIYILLPLILVSLFSCNPQFPPPNNQDPTLLHRLNIQLSEAIVQDGFSPPVASRIYAYTNIAAYESLQHTDTLYQSLATQLNQLPPINPPLPQTHSQIAMVQAFKEVAITLIYRDFIIENLANAILDSLKAQTTQSIYRASISFGSSIAQVINQWAAQDYYKESRNLPLFTPSPEAGKWQPTPPTYSEAIEPYWNRIRPFLLDSASQFMPPAPIPFSTQAQSPFYLLAQQVYDTTNALSEEKVAIARFWDCNPVSAQTQGHLMYVKRQLTPGGHWMGITTTITKQLHKPLLPTAEAYTRTAIALADAFISCWDEKYRSNLIRPETYINQHIDKAWKPILQTPMFPEHTSGHSVASNAAATILTQLFGNNIAYIDSVNVPFGLPPRSFTSFQQAAEEASISRLYGGIHYMPAIQEGIIQGQKVGQLINRKLITHKKP